MKKIHKFEANGKFIVLDIFSGSIFVVDELTYSMIDYYNNGVDYILEKLPEYDENTIREVYGLSLIHI